MRTLLASLLGLLMVCAVAQAGDDSEADVGMNFRESCNLNYVAYDWDFNTGDHGFTTTQCEAGGAAVWAYGLESSVPGSPGNVWATVLNGNYPNSSGHGLLSPAFTVTAGSNMMEIGHYVHIETNFDGGNVSVNGTVIPPTDGYPATISTSTSYYAYCVDMEEGFTGNGYNGASELWVARCFDLSAYMGQEIQVEFDFGSDSSVTYPGWYLAYVRVGGNEPTAIEPTTWGRVKSLYR